MSSRSFWAVGFFEAFFRHSSLNSLHHLQMLAFETPNVVVTRIKSPFTRGFFFRQSCYNFSLPQQSVKTYTAENDYQIAAPSGRVIETPG